MGKTVTTYLVDGDPKGTRYVFISNKICKMYLIPRSDTQISKNPHFISFSGRIRIPSLWLILVKRKTFGRE